MRRLLTGVVLSVLSCAALAGQGPGTAALQRVIHVPILVNAKGDACGHIATAVHYIGMKVGVLTGVERVPGMCELDANEADLIDLQGMSVEDALNRIVEIDPRYSWDELDGVIVMRPVEAWSDPQNVLNQVAPGFAMGSGNYAHALNLWRTAAWGEGSRSLAALHGRRYHGKRQFSLTTRSMGFGHALDAIVRAHGALGWMVSYKAAPASRDTMVAALRTFDNEGTLTQR